MNALLATIKHAAAFALAATCASAATVWIEGESFLRSNRQYNPWMNGEPRSLASGGATAAFLDSRAEMAVPLYILWRFDVREPGVYAVHMRILSPYENTYGHTRFRMVRIDPELGVPLERPDADAGWSMLDCVTPATDPVPAGNDRTWKWTRQGTVYLEPGSYLLDLQTLGAGERNPSIWGSFDAILLTTDLTFSPRGTTPPN